MSRMSAKGYNVRGFRDAQLYVVGTALGDGYVSMVSTDFLCTDYCDESWLRRGEVPDRSYLGQEMLSLN
jgi:hypothetical protein